MRMFLVCMTDIFLILYLTTLSHVKPGSVLTVDDFFTVKAMHEALIEDKDALEARLAEEKNRTEEIQESLRARDEQLGRIDQELLMQEQTLHERQQLLDEVTERIAEKEASWQKKEATYAEELRDQKVMMEENLLLVARLEREVQQAQRLAEQMQEEAALAQQTAETARAIEEKAVILKDHALQEKKETDARIDAAIQERARAEEEKADALARAEEALRQKREADALVEAMLSTIEAMKQEGQAAYSANVLPHMQQLDVRYGKQAGDNEMRFFSRTFTLFPVELGGKSYVIIPARHIGFGRRTEDTPQSLEMSYHGQTLSRSFMNAEKDLVAVELSGYRAPAAAGAPHSSNTELTQLMPVLLALRNNEDLYFFDRLRGLSREYFMVTRDYLEAHEDGSLTYSLSGFRGTGTYGERIVRGDQLVDLDGRFIGVATDVNHIKRIDTINGWEELQLERAQ
jgi:chemotaxis protein histidine kinase CheA